MKKYEEARDEAAEKCADNNEPQSETLRYLVESTFESGSDFGRQYEKERSAKLIEAFKEALSELFTTSRATVFDGDRIQKANADYCATAYKKGLAALADYEKKGGEK